MNFTATNLRNLLQQLNPKGYSLDPRYISNQVKSGGSYVLHIDDKKYTIGHPFRGTWTAQLHKNTPTQTKDRMPFEKAAAQKVFNKSAHTFDLLCTFVDSANKFQKCFALWANTMDGYDVKLVTIERTDVGVAIKRTHNGTWKMLTMADVDADAATFDQTFKSYNRPA